METLTVIGIIIEIVILFNFVILVHELGHFLAARWRGLKIEKFQIWFGKPIWSKKINGVQWGIGWIPAGGFVALPQMAPMEMLEGKSENAEPLPKISSMDKIIVAFAGPLFSFGLAFAFAVLVWAVMRPVGTGDATTTIGYVSPEAVEGAENLRPGDEILEVDGRPVDSWRGMVDSVAWNVISSSGDTIDFKVKREGVAEPLVIPVKAPLIGEEAAKAAEAEGKEAPEGSKRDGIKGFFTRPQLRQIYDMGIASAAHPMVQRTIKNSPAEKAGIQEYDILVSVDGQPLRSRLGLSDIIRANPDQPMEIGLRRGEEELTVTMTPEKPEGRDHHMIGVVWDPIGETRLVRESPIQQIKRGVQTMYNTLAAVASPKSKISARHLSGPVGIMNVYYRLFKDKDGWRRALWFSVILNINLGILNLLPLPVLDGGHITMAILESIRKRPLSKPVMDVAYGGCALLLIGFMVFITGFDVTEIFGGAPDVRGIERTADPPPPTLPNGDPVFSP